MINLKIIPESETEKFGKLELIDNDKTLLKMTGLAEFSFDNQMKETIKISTYLKKDEEIQIEGNSDNFKCEVSCRKGAVDGVEFSELRYKVENISSGILRGRFKITFKVLNCFNPRWLIPGIFYKDNNAKLTCWKKFPKFNIEPELENFISNQWSFSARRAAMPVIFCWADEFMCAIFTPIYFSHGNPGFFFHFNGSETEIALLFPYTEEPLSYVYFRNFKPDFKSLNLNKGELIKFSFKIFLGKPDLHNYDKILRWFYHEMKEFNLPSPWFTLEKGAELSAYGLYNWHFDEENNVIFETRGFDNVLSLNVGGKDTRKHMHISWVSGITYAFALMKYGYIIGDSNYIKAGKSVINKIVNEGNSPAGILWSQWTAENGWTDGWNPEPELTQARTLSEAILFLCRAYQLEKNKGFEHEKWKECILKNLKFAIGIQNEKGNFGSYYNSNTGEVKIYEGCAGLMWIPALIEGHKIFGEEKFKNSAIKAGFYYAKFINDEFIYGAPEDAFMVPTSEDTYNAVISYISLYEITKDKTWLDLARKSADLMMTFRFSYNLDFPEGTILNMYKFKTIGGDIASPVNQHLHNYGLICVPEMLKLYKFTQDDYYLERTIDNICFSLQFIARFDGDFNAFKGMMPEQFYYVDWIRPVGTILTLSHAWCLGMVIYAFVSIFESEFKDLIFQKIREFCQYEN